MKKEKDLVEPRNITLYPINWSIIESFAKDMGYPSTSSAIRRIIDEWVQMKQDSSTSKANSDG